MTFHIDSPVVARTDGHVISKFSWMRSKPNFVTHDALESSTIVWKRKIVAAAAVEFFVNAVVPRALTLLLE